MSAVTSMILSASFAAASAGDLMSVDPATVLLEVVIFLGLIAILRVVVFNPLVKVLEAREKSIDGARAEAEARVQEADARMAEYEDRLRQVRAQAAAERDALRAEGRAAEAALLDKVKEETAKAVEQGKAAVRRDAEALEKELQAHEQTLADVMVTRVLGRESPRTGS